MKASPVRGAVHDFDSWRSRSRQLLPVLEQDRALGAECHGDETVAT